MASVTVTLPHAQGTVVQGAVAWHLSSPNRVSLGLLYPSMGLPNKFIARFSLPRRLSGRIDLYLADSQTQSEFSAGPDFSTQMEGSGTITVLATDNSSIVITGIGDATDPYFWVPPNIVALEIFADNLALLHDRTLTVTFNDNANLPPTVTIATPSPATIDHAGTTTLDGTVTDPDDTPTIAWSSDIGGTFSDQDAADTDWTAPSSITDAATATLTLSATDSENPTVTASVQVTVRGQTTTPLAVSAPADQTGATGDIVGINVPAATGGRAPYVYSYSGLPPETGGLGRLIQGRLITSGSYTVTVTVTDANGDTDSDTFDWTVTGTDIAPPTGLNVRIDWGEQFFANPHADVTARMRSGVSCERGKTTGASTLGRTASGKLALTLDNSDSLYDQENSASDLFGLIRPGIMVQFRNGADVLWSGVLDSIPTRYDKSPAAQHRATVTAYGLYSTLTEAQVSDGSLTPETTAQAFCTLLESIGEMGVPQTGTFATMARWWERGSMRDALRHIEDTEGGFIYEARKLDLGFQPAGHRASLFVSKTFSGGEPAAGRGDSYCWHTPEADRREGRGQHGQRLRA